MKTRPHPDNRACLDCLYVWRYPSKPRHIPPRIARSVGSTQVQKPQRDRSVYLIVGGVIFLGFVVLAGIGIIAGDQNKAATTTDDGLSVKVDPAEKLQGYIRELKYANDANKPEAYKRIITHLSDSGDRDRAIEYCNLALAEGLDIKFGYSDLDRLFDGARQVIVEREEKKLAEIQAEEWAEEWAEAQQAAVEKEMNRGNVEATKLFYEVVQITGHHSVIADLYSHKDGPPWQLTITVNERWGALPNGTRLEHARLFRGAWAGVCPVEPGGPRISMDIVNMAGTPVGGGARSQESYWAD